MLSLASISLAATFTDTSCSGNEFDDATLTDTECVSNSIQLDSTGLTNGYGTTTSRVLDGGEGASWSNIGWSPTQPYMKELPISGGTDSGYTAGAIDMSDCVAYFRLNETSANSAPSGNDIEDFCGGSHHLADSGTVTYDKVGRLNGAVDFDGSSGLAMVADHADLNPSSITIAAWINMDTFGQASWGRIVDKGTASGLSDDYVFYVDNSNITKGLAFYANNGGIDETSTNNVIDTGDWYHVAITYNSATNDGIFYVNGYEVSSFSDPSGLGDTTGDFTIGGRAEDLREFDGRLDEIALFSSALSAGDILNIYKRGAFRVKMRVASCNDAACSGETLVGPDGTAADFYSELSTSTNASPSKTLFNVSDNQYFQYQMVMESTSSTLGPLVEDVTVTYTASASVVPEFSDVMYFLTLVVGFWYAAKKVILPQSPLMPS